MPERKTEAAEPKSAVAKAEPSAGLRPSAGESTDPVVHQLIANRRAHEMILEAPDSTADNRKSAEASIAAIDQQLQEMGYR